MPTCRRKRVVLAEPSPELLKAVKADPKRPVFYLHTTGEIFETYEEYAARMSFYRLRQFQCEVTGKSGLDYFQALESERQEARTLHSRFPEPLKSAVLKAVQWQVVGRLDHLVEAVYERFKDRYFKNEYVIVDLNGLKFQARVDRVYPPKFSEVEDRDKFQDHNLSDLDDENPHSAGGDLRISLQESIELDGPERYFYWVKLLEVEKDKGHEKGKGKSDRVDGKLVGSLVEVQSPMMSRDRLAFSKSILRRFIRDCVDRDAAVASPWTVKPIIAARYGVDSVMPEATRRGVEDIKKGEIDKRKKAWEDKEGPPTKKQKKMTAAQEEKAKASLAAAEKKERDARDKAEKQRLAKEEAERLAAEKKKKKPIRYPTEDLDVKYVDKDKKAGVLRLQRPIANRAILPFNKTPGAFESFIMAWNFLVVYGQPLHLSVFTLDEFEGAIQHSDPDLPCPLLAEIHSTLVYNLRTVPFVRHSCLLSLLKHKEESEQDGLPDEAPHGVTMDMLTACMADVGNNWERVPLRFSEGREGWEEAVVGCLKDHANLINFPGIRDILTKLLFAPSHEDDSESVASGSRASPSAGRDYDTTASPRDRYYALNPEERISILAFMCNLAISSKAIHAHMESCEEQLTALRKEKIEVNRLKKQYLEEISALADETKEDAAASNGTGEDVTMQDASDVSEAPELKPKTHSKEREAARAKQASLKQAQAERRRLDEEMAKLERRLEGIERDFRKLLGAIRVKPLGRDRFYNRIWWFDGMGAASLVGNNGQVQYGAGRLFIQGPSEFDLDLLNQREENLEERRLEEEGEEGMLKSTEWAVYSEVEELDELLAWLNPKGQRELALRNLITRWSPHITAGMKKRITDLTSTAIKNTDTRRSARTKAATIDLSREAYMLWVNRKAISAS